MIPPKEINKDLTADTKEIEICKLSDKESRIFI